MNKLLLLTLILTTTACRADSYTRPPYTLGQEKCEKIVTNGGMVLSACELSVGFERTCYLIQKNVWAFISTPCKFYDEVVRSPKVVR